MSHASGTPATAVAQLTAQPIEALNAGTIDACTGALAPLFEGATTFLARLAMARPFDSWQALFEQARTIAQAMPEKEQIELVDAHPRLGAPPASVSAMSFREQGYDADAAANLATEATRERDRVAADLDRLNRAYEAQFGFRYCVFVASRSRSELLPGMAASLGRERDSELHRALDAVIDIAIDRHERVAGATSLREAPRG